ncbi:MAG: type ISP restriction/modification enzyme [Emticicia sp.]|nr:type ISP restriction/modification enzyme [Emticicia sp.]
MFILNNVGIVTAKDAILVNESKRRLIKNTETYFNIEVQENKIQQISYRPFDNRFVYYDVKIIERAREKLMKHFLIEKNIGLVFRRQQPESLDFYIFCSDKIIADGYIRSDNKGGESIAPLYLYPDNNGQQTIDQNNDRKPNLNAEIVNQIAENLGLQFRNEKASPPSGDLGGYFAPIDILDYIYAVLHSPTYREKYKEFLKIDFPKVPYPSSNGGIKETQEKFWTLVALGAELRQIHLLESPILEKQITQYPIDGDNVVTKIVANPRGEFVDVYINESQYFKDVPLVAWNFYIGGYQPAQKWLKDRKERTLEFEDIQHYQKIIVALSETDRIMAKINEIDIEAKP